MESTKNNSEGTVDKDRSTTIYVVTCRTQYEMYSEDEWVHVPDSDNDASMVMEAHVDKPSSDMLAVYANLMSHSILDFWKEEGHDISSKHIETTVNTQDLYQEIVRGGNLRAAVTVEATETKLRRK